MEKDYATIRDKRVLGRFRDLYGKNFKQNQIFALLLQNGCKPTGRVDKYGQQLFVYGSDDDYEITIDSVLNKLSAQKEKEEYEDYYNSYLDNLNNDEPNYEPLESNMDYCSQQCLDNQNESITFNDPNDDKLYESIIKNKKNKNVYLTESQLNKLKNNINENTKIKIHFVEPQKVLCVKKYLDNSFVRASMPIISDEGYPKTVLLVGMKGTDGKVAKNMTDKQLIELLIDKFQNIYSDKDKRYKFLKQVMIDWFNKRISNEGLLSVNRF